MSLVMAVALPLFSCHKTRAPIEEISGEQVVLATIDGQPLTVGELRADIGQRSSYYRLRFRSPDGEKQLLKDLLDFEVMAKEAKDRGYDKKPEVVRTAKQQMINMLIQGGTKQASDQVSDAAVEQYYRTHTSEFTQAESVKITAVIVKDKSKVDAAIAAANRLRPNDPAGFANLVARYSDDAESRGKGGDLGMIDRSSRRWPFSVVEESFKLKQVGEISGPILTDRGTFILRLVERVPPQTRELEKVRNQVVQRLAADSRTQRMEAWTENVRSKHKVTVFEDKLGQVDLTAPEPTAKEVQ